MSVAYLLNSTYSNIKNEKLDQNLVVSGSLKAPLHRVGENVELTENESGNLNINAPVVECTQIEAPIAVIESIVGLQELELAGSTGLEGQVLGLDSGLNLAWLENPSASNWSAYPATSNVDLDNNDLDNVKELNTIELNVQNPDKTQKFNLQYQDAAFLEADQPALKLNNPNFQYAYLEASNIWASNSVSSQAFACYDGTTGSSLPNAELSVLNGYQFYVKDQSSSNRCVWIQGDNNALTSQTQCEVQGFGSVSCSKLLPNFKLQQDYFVSPNGDDTNGNGSIENPYQTIQACINQCESLTLNDNLYRYIHICGGDYSNENLTITKKVFLIGEGKNRDSSGVGCSVGNISLSLDSNPNDMFNNQVCLSGLLIKSITDVNSSVQFVCNVVNSYIYNNNSDGRAINFSNTAMSDCRLWLENVNILTDNNSGSAVNPTIEINKGMLRMNIVNINSKGNQNILKLGGTSRVDNIVMTSFGSQTNSTTAKAIVEISSTSTSVFSFANCSFSYSNSANKSASATSCAILCSNSSVPTTLILAYNSFALAGTTNLNYVVNYTTVQNLTLFFSNLATLTNASAINGTNGVSKFSLQAVA